MRKISGILLFFLLQALLITTTYGQKSAVDSFVTGEMKRLHIPGFEACAIDSGKVVWTGYYGFQHIGKHIQVSGQTLFDVASTTKTITGAALMQLYAAGRFKLDDDVNAYLDFRVRNPNFAKTPITFRELLRHRSSITDNNDYLGQFWDSSKGDPTVSLRDLLVNYLSPGGAHYDRNKNFRHYPPNARAEYCNVGIALIGYLVERLSGMPFDVFCKKQLFQPLAMPRTNWFLRNVDSQYIAMPYRYSDSLQQYQAWGYEGFPDYPAGALYTNVEEFSHFLIAWTQHGRWNNRQVMDSNAIQQLTPVDFNLGFHVWFLYGTDKGSLLYCHTGRGNGVSAFISYNPRSTKGLIFLTNGELNEAADWRRIVDGLYEKVF